MQKDSFETKELREHLPALHDSLSSRQYCQIKNLLTHFLHNTIELICSSLLGAQHSPPRRSDDYTFCGWTFHEVFEPKLSFRQGFCRNQKDSILTENVHLKQDFRSDKQMVHPAHQFLIKSQIKNNMKTFHNFGLTGIIHKFNNWDFTEMLKKLSCKVKISQSFGNSP